MLWYRNIAGWVEEENMLRRAMFVFLTFPKPPPAPKNSKSFIICRYPFHYNLDKSHFIYCAFLLVVCEIAHSLVCTLPPVELSLPNVRASDHSCVWCKSEERRPWVSWYSGENPKKMMTSTIRLAPILGIVYD